MGRIRENKEIISVFIIGCLGIILLYLVLFQNVHLFYGDRNEAATLLGTMIQCLATVTAIVFALILFVGEFSLGKYVTRTLDYVILNSLNFSMLVFFIAVTVLNILVLSNLTTEYWRLWVDVSVILSVICMISLFPFFLLIPKSLKPRTILGTIMKEIVCKKQKEQQFVSEKIELMFSIVGKLRDGGESSDAFYGIALMGETVRSLDLKKFLLPFLSSFISKLESFGIESLSKQPSLALGCIDELRNILNSLDPKEHVEMHYGCRAVMSSLEICEVSLSMRNAEAFLYETYELILGLYELSALGDYDVGLGFGIEAITKIQKYANQIGLPIYHLLTLRPIWPMIRLLERGKREEALDLFSVLFDPSPKEETTLRFCIDLLFWVRESKEFSIKVVETIKQSYGPINIEVKTSQEKSTRRIHSLSSNNVEIEVEDEKDRDVALWIKSSLR